MSSGSRSDHRHSDDAAICLAIVGSRDFPDLHQVRKFIQTLPPDTIIVSGGARGVDRCAAAAARARGLQVVEFLADWDRLGKRAGFVRNREIVERCDRMVAFWDGLSSGTRHSIELARRMGRPVDIYFEESTVSLTEKP